MPRRRPPLASAIAIGVVVLAGPDVARAHHPQGDGWSPSLVILVVAVVTFAAVWLLAGFGAPREPPAADEEATRPPADRGER